MTTLPDPDSSPALTRRNFNLMLAGLTAAGSLRLAAQNSPPAATAPSGPADAAWQRALRAARADADSLLALPLDGVPPAFTPRAT